MASSRHVETACPTSAAMARALPASNSPDSASITTMRRAQRQRTGTSSHQSPPLRPLFSLANESFPCIPDAAFRGGSSLDCPSISGSSFLLLFSPVQTTAELHYALALRHGNENPRPFGVLDSSPLAGSGSPSTNFSSWHAALPPGALGSSQVPRPSGSVSRMGREHTQGESQ